MVYEKDGETIVVNDTYICEYKGVEWNEGIGKHRTWNGYIRGSGFDVVVLHEDNDITVYCVVGNAGYYMEIEDGSQQPLTPQIYETDWKED